MSGQLDVSAARAALAPVRSAVLDAAHAESERVLTAAEDDARSLIADAEARASALVDLARKEGDADAAVALATERSRARRRARGVVLKAQGDAHAALVAAARSAVTRLADDDEWPAMREVLLDRLHDALGPDAEVVDMDGGITGRSGAVELDLSLAQLADSALGAMGARIEEVWQP